MSVAKGIDINSSISVVDRLNLVSLLILTQGRVFIDFRETRREVGRQGERERERDVNSKEKHQSVASCTHPDQGPHPQPRYVP